MSTSAIPEPVSAEFNLGANEYTTRHSIVSFEPSAKTNDGRLAYDVFPPREGNFSDVSGMEALNFWTDDHESSQTSNIITPRTMMSHDPYQGICIEVNNHSLSNQGVVLYHVDIKGPEGMLSTYTIRRRYRAFKNLYEEMNRLMTNYANIAAGASPVSGLESSASVPLSPHSQSQLRHQQTFTRVTLPALPSAGVWTYLKRHDIRLVDQRKKRFQEILSIAIRHPATRNSPVLDSFLSVAPSEISQRGSSYVSLHEYSVPVFDRERESIERKQRKRRVLEGRRMRTDSESNRGFP
ncbi:hypothetical protein Poli38472_010054 [Pythium oligandrum]|uniref:PX domain-containing protein n=1 Tax=Pythium oligandrum TaxID=41045 RepID=A0A8K1C8M8_PYTOL|nr:hypothetical protein Poli38472_010054 [Pythium oligandrum]|eukprot:TMW58495.1 hypothetical protein Poli38472_010054 [Pythium oligandrum]